ncbi:MAG: zinc ribbon domain-containing protein, partial [Clostridia bacterium]|nr:zinc ribbon domain-containing protein [Clostridia bacterium]
LIEFCASHMANEHFTVEQAREYMKNMLPALNYWKKFSELSDKDNFDKFKKELINDFNSLHIEGMPKVTELSALIGAYVNLEYTMPNGHKIKYLDDGATYLGYQLEGAAGGRCFGLVGNADFLLVCTYGENGEDPELLVYKKR